METIVQDVRYAIRQLLRQPGFSVIAMLTLGLGLGATIAVFTVIDAAMLRPLPYPDPEQLVTITVETPQFSGRSLRLAPSLDEIQRWQNDFTDVVGTLAGLAGAAAATPLIASFLFQTDPTDATTLAAVAVTLTATGCFAAWLPSRRAARVDPVTALRAE
jgi:ABC-type antimicrobial peptide transport system permease subunit